MPVVMGTAGHIDHGKTTLVKKLTGIDCDRLNEEHRRGITIELGFAFMPLPDNRRLSIVDVPGHERFVHTMMSGASGIDFVVLVIAADEGVMPQTREHLEICTLLGIRRGVVALTKVDTVDEMMLELAKDDVCSFLAGTFLENAPIFPVSAISGEGMDALNAKLIELEKTLAPKRRSDLFRLPVDRVFTLKGHGTVITGTMISGSAAVGDEVMLYPSMQESKIRALQSHGETVEVALAGRRTAVNVSGLSVDDIERGEVLSHKGALLPSTSWIVELTCLPSSPRPLLHRKEVHFHHGARSVQARLYFPKRESLAPGETDICEVRFSSPMVGVFDDQFVIRSFSPLRTVAGGIVIRPLEVDLRRKAPLFLRRVELLEEIATSSQTKEELKDLSQEASGSVKGGKQAPTIEEKRIFSVINLAENTGVNFSTLCTLTNLDSRVLEKHLAHLSGKQFVFCTDKEERLYHGEETIVSLSELFVAFLRNFHASFPMKEGVTRLELHSKTAKKLSIKLVHFILERLVKAKRLAVSKDFYHLIDHKVSLANDQSALREKILAAHKKAGMTPPNMKDVLEELSVTMKEAAPLLKLMQDTGEICKVAEGIWYDSPTLDTIEKQIVSWFATHENLDLAGLKEMTGLSRKYLVALLEYFDMKKLTVRVGDKRILRR